MKEYRRINKSDMRKLCIDHDYFNCGDNDDYNILFDLIDIPNITTDKLVSIARYIKKFSDTDECLEYVCYKLSEISYSVFETEYDDVILNIKL